MRWLVGCALVLAVTAGSAHARKKIVIMEPAVAAKCDNGKSWAAVEKCLGGLGKLTILRTLPNSKLVKVSIGDGDSISLYMSIAGKWQLAGLYESNGNEYEVLDASPVTVVKHTGVRLEIGELMRSGVSPDGVTTIPALFAMRRVLFCSGEGWRCPEVTTSCDVIVRGQAIWSFRGRISISDDRLDVFGDRRNSGPFCSVPSTQFLGWPAS